MSPRHPDLETGDIVAALEDVGLIASETAKQSLEWHFADKQLVPADSLLAAARGEAVAFDRSQSQTVIVYGTSCRDGQTRRPDVRFGYIDNRNGALVVSRAGAFVPELFAMWSRPVPQVEAPLITEARKEGWL